MSALRKGGLWPPDISGSQLGGGIRTSILEGRRVGEVEKRHLVLKRWCDEELAAQDRHLIDVGTDHGYPFFDGYPPTEAAIISIGESARTARVYPSSYGTERLRTTFAMFMFHRFGVVVDPAAQVMVSTGASQVFDALSRTMAGRYVLVPRLTLSTVTSIAVGNGAEIVRIDDDAQGNPDLNHLRRLIERAGPGNVRFIYVNSPTNPTGHVLGLAYLRGLVDLAREFRVLVVHDHDSWHTVHIGAPVPSILEIPEAAGIAVTIVSLSKELGLPGVRVGLIAGNTWAVNALRMHNSEFCVMVPEFCQAAATTALRLYTATIDTDLTDRARVQAQIAQALEVALLGWESLGWPIEAMHPPIAGFKFLLAVPPAFAGGTDESGISGVELFDFFTARYAGVKLSTSRSFNPLVADRLRMIVMQPSEVMRAVFAALGSAGVHYRMSVPAGLVEEYQAVITGLDLSNL